MKQLWILTALFVFLLHSGARADTSLVFNEVMYHPGAGQPEAEWVEFYNQLGVDIDVSDWALDGGIRYSLPPGTVVPGAGYLVLAGSTAGDGCALPYTGISL